MGEEERRARLRRVGVHLLVPELAAVADDVLVDEPSGDVWCMDGADALDVGQMDGAATTTELVSLTCEACAIRAMHWYAMQAARLSAWVTTRRAITASAGHAAACGCRDCKIAGVAR